MLENNKVGKRIRQIRKELGHTMQAFGELFDPVASKGVVSNWENNYNLPNNERLKKISELGGLTVNELLYGDLNEYIYSVLHEELLEVSNLYHEIIRYLLLTNAEIEKISDENDKNDVLQIESEHFLRTHIKHIVERIEKNNGISNANNIYGNENLVIDLAIQYTNHLINNFNNKVIFDEEFTLKLLKDITCKDVDDSFIGETKYIFECRISLEFTSYLGNREDLEIAYSGDIIANIFITAGNKPHHYQFGGFYSLYDDPYRRVFDNADLVTAKKEIVKEVLKSDELKEFNFKFEEFNELSK